MISAERLQKRREYKHLKRKQLHKFLMAIREYPKQIVARDNLIAYLKHSRDEMFQQVQDLLKRLEKYEKKD